MLGIVVWGDFLDKQIAQAEMEENARKDQKVQLQQQILFKENELQSERKKKDEATRKGGRGH